MQVGVLWYDNKRRSLAENVLAAAKRYQVRFGERANTCYVHPDQLPDGDCEVREIYVKSSPQILPHHYWAGVEKSESSTERPISKDTPDGGGLSENVSVTARGRLSQQRTTKQQVSEDPPPRGQLLQLRMWE